jgi:hypothetical protein
MPWLALPSGRKKNQALSRRYAIMPIKGPRLRLDALCGDLIVETYVGPTRM